jgi:hypothetical protein
VKLLDNAVRHEGFKQEIQTLRALMEERKREKETHEHPPREEEYMSDDDDTHSVGTVVPHELDRVEEEDEESASQGEERRRKRNELQPSTPEPRGGDSNNDDLASKLSRQSVCAQISGNFTNTLLLVSCLFIVISGYKREDFSRIQTKKTNDSSMVSPLW